MNELPLVGIDIVDVERFARSLERTPKLRRRLFTAGEIAYCEGPSAMQRFAARFAAKEATLKVFGYGIEELSWHEMEIVKDLSGQPRLRLPFEMPTRVSLSHTGTCAQAIVMIPFNARTYHHHDEGKA